MTANLDLLAVGAHPDDVEVHVGGLLALAAARGLRTGILDLTRGELGTRGTPEGRAVMTALRTLRPAVLVIPSPEDRHPDHRRAHRLLREAAFHAGLKGYPHEGEPWRPEALAWVGGENPDRPDLMVDVSAVWAQRMAAFDAFGSQFGQDPTRPDVRIAHPSFRRGIEGRAMHWGSLIQADFAEALWCEKPVPPALLRLLERLR
jgi:LmbE family N-acetylglucosaminyl deacetylase